MVAAFTVSFCGCAVTACFFAVSTGIAAFVLAVSFTATDSCFGAETGTVAALVDMVSFFGCATVAGLGAVLAGTETGGFAAAAG
jgi:hypothetical protein